MRLLGAGSQVTGAWQWPNLQGQALAGMNRASTHDLRSHVKDCAAGHMAEEGPAAHWLVGGCRAGACFGSVLTILVAFRQMGKEMDPRFIPGPLFYP